VEAFVWSSALGIEELSLCAAFPVLLTRDRQFELTPAGSWRMRRWLADFVVGREVALTEAKYRRLADSQVRK